MRQRGLHGPGGLVACGNVTQHLRRQDQELREKALRLGQKAGCYLRKPAALRKSAYKKRPADAARLYAAAFDEEPRLAGDLKSHARYDAACAAALGSVARPARESRALRRQALTWLRADLRAWQRALAPGASPVAVRQTLRNWQTDADLAGLRGDSELSRLPAEERQAWQRLWADVDHMLRQSTGGRGTR